MCDNDSPKEEGEKSRGDNYALDKEQDPELLNRHESQAGLSDPVEKEAEEASRSDASVLGQMVGKALEAGPDSFNAILEKCTGLNTENGRPHGGNKGTQADGWVGAVHAK